MMFEAISVERAGPPSPERLRSPWLRSLKSCKTMRKESNRMLEVSEITARCRLDLYRGREDCTLGIPKKTITDSLIYVFCGLYMMGCSEQQTATPVESTPMDVYLMLNWKAPIQAPIPSMVRWMRERTHRPLAHFRRRWGWMVQHHRA